MHRQGYSSQVTVADGCDTVVLFFPIEETEPSKITYISNWGDWAVGLDVGRLSGCVGGKLGASS